MHDKCRRGGQPSTERAEWVLAQRVVDGSIGAGETALTLAREVLRLRELAEVKYELLRAERGMDVVEQLRPRIDKLYMALNAQARGDENDLDGDPVQPWNRLIELAVTALVRWVASEKWAAAEHRAADDLRASLAMVNEGAPAPGGNHTTAKGADDGAV